MLQINLDSTKVIITEYKIVESFFLERFLLPVSWIAIKLDCKDTRSHIYAHITIFRLRGGGGEITQEN